MESGAIVAGIGTNVNQADLPPDIATIATSLRLASGRPHSREQLLIRLLPPSTNGAACSPAKAASPS